LKIFYDFLKVYATIQISKRNPTRIFASCTFKIQNVTSVKLALIQANPVYADLAKGIEKAIQLINQAVDQGADIVAFPECWLTGYPAWIDYHPMAAQWDNPVIKEAWANLYQNSPEIDGPEIQDLCQLAAEREVVIVMGMNEAIKTGPRNGSLFNTVILINEKGELAIHHRKLMPTFNEKLIHTFGDGAGLVAADTKVGRVTILICWEHWMPLTRQALHDEQEDLHIALWPMVKPLHQIACQQYAFEGRCFVAAVGNILQSKHLPPALRTEDAQEDQYLLNGGSSFIGPDTQFLLDPQGPEQEIILTEIPPKSILDQEKITFAASGHYQRHDVFDLKVDKRRK